MTLKEYLTSIILSLIPNTISYELPPVPYGGLKVYNPLLSTVDQEGPESYPIYIKSVETVSES